METFNKFLSDPYRKETMCYKTSHELLKKYKGKTIKTIVESENGKIHLPFKWKKNFAITMEIHILDDSEPLLQKNILKEYNINNKFFIPRLFIHSFNIIREGNKVVLGQSWFTAHKYKKINSFNVSNFKEWFKDLISKINNFKNNPEEIFSLFKIKLEGNQSYKLNLIRLIKENVKKIKTDIEIYYKPI